MMNSQRIMIVDDEPSFVEACRRTFEARNYEVVTASSAVEAQEMMKADPCIVVLGTIAPAGQAFSLHEWLRGHRRYRDVPLMVIDAQREERPLRGWRRWEGMQLVADDYVSKPIEPAALVPRIQRLLESVTQKIRVLVADDHTMVRHGLCAVLGLQKDIYVVGEAVNGQDALDKALRLVPDVALMDIVMPVMNGLEVTRRVSQECPQIKVLVLTQYDEEENMVVAKKAGACGFIPKKAASSDLLDGIRSVYRGGCFPRTFAELSAN